MPKPLLIISDAPSGTSGLARITKDLATRVAQNIPEYKVATLGYGAPGSCKLPFQQYVIEGMKDWMIPQLPEIWEDLASNEPGAILTIWDASRLLWFGRPETCESKWIRDFLNRSSVEKWGYFPMDATGPNDKLTKVLNHTMEGYDRVLAYSKWAEDILKRGLNPEEVNDLSWLPHGIDTSIWYPRHRMTARHGIGQKTGARTSKGKFLAIPDDAMLIGVVATNQLRKDWGLAFRTAAELNRQHKVYVWAHCDDLERHFSLPALINDYGFSFDQVFVTFNLTEEQLAWCYTACDVTLGIGLGEGFGFPIFESLACGTPCIHCNYGGAAEHMPKEMLVDPIYYRIETPYNMMRPVMRVEDWVTAVNRVYKTRTSLPPHLDWNNLWPSWEAWFRKGLK